MTINNNENQRIIWVQIKIHKQVYELKCISSSQSTNEKQIDMNK